MYNRLNVNNLFFLVIYISRRPLECILGFNVNQACVRVCMPYFYASSIRLKVFVVIQHHHKIPTLYLLAPLVLILV